MGQGSSPLLSGPPKSVFAWRGLPAQPQQPINDALPSQWAAKGSAILHRQTGSCMDHVALPPPTVRLVAMLSQHDEKASNLAPGALEPSKRSHLRRRTTASRKKPTAVTIRNRLHRLHPPELPGSRVTQGQKGSARIRSRLGSLCRPGRRLQILHT